MKIEALQQTHSAPGVKQQLAAVRMLFDWLITGQVVPANPASGSLNIRLAKP
jgi:site-specific recombinase XerC